MYGDTILIIIDHKCDQCWSNFPIFLPNTGWEGGVMYDAASGYIDSIFTRPPFCQDTPLLNYSFLNKILPIFFNRLSLYLSSRKYEIAARLVFGLNMKIALEKYSKEVEQIIFLIYSQRNLQRRWNVREICFNVWQFIEPPVGFIFYISASWGAEIKTRGYSCMQLNEKSLL